MPAPGLGALGDYGGPTETFEMLPGCDLVDLYSWTCHYLDQRGVSRPAGAACDVGATEDGKGRHLAGLARRPVVAGGGDDDDEVKSCATADGNPQQLDRGPR